MKLILASLAGSFFLALVVGRFLGEQDKKRLQWMKENGYLTEDER